MPVRLVLVLAAMMVWPAASFAAQKVAVFPFEINFQSSEEDFYIGEKKATPEEEARLKLAHEEFVKRMAADGRYQIVDLTPVAADIQSAQPIHSCNECDTDIAKKAGADLVLTAVFDKASDTLLNLIVTIRNVETRAQVRNLQVVIQGNTDDTWLHGARWLLKNRLLTEGDSR